MTYFILGILILLAGAAFWLSYRTSKKQEAWREKKLRDIEARKRKIADRKKKAEAAEDIDKTDG